MKKMILGVVLLSSINSYATTAKVFCKDDNGVKNVLSEDGWECRDELLSGGNACFTGSRVEAIAILNSLESSEYFDGTDGEFVTKADFQGTDEISYLSVDDANGFATKVSMQRCTAEFFKN